MSCSKAVPHSVLFVIFIFRLMDISSSVCYILFAIASVNFCLSSVFLCVAAVWQRVLIFIFLVVVTNTTFNV